MAFPAHPDGDRASLPADGFAGWCEGYDDNGVDLTLIDEMLRLTPRERLVRHQENMTALVELMARAGHQIP